MHTVDLLDEALSLAEHAGFEIRNEIMDQATGGACRIGRKWLLYVDQSLPATDQLTQVVLALRASGIVRVEPHTSPTLRTMLDH